MINYGIGHLAYGLLNFIVVLILLTFLIIALFGLIRFLHSRKWLNAPKCEKCGAPVTLQDKECPECGENLEFDFSSLTAENINGEDEDED